MNDPVDVLAQLTKAGGMVGISNNKWWLDLAIAHGPACVLAIVDEIHADTRQAVNVATVAKRCEKEARQKQDEADDAAEDAAMARQRARAPTVHVHPTGSKVTAAAVVSEPASVAAATDAHSIQAAPTEDNQGIDMTTVKQLVKNVEDEITRRDIATKDAMAEIGVSQTSIYNWRRGICSPRMQEKIAAWLSGSTTTAGTAAAEFAAEAKPKPQKARRPPPAVEAVEQPWAATSSDLGCLLTQGANLRDVLNALGSTGYADVVQALVDRLRAMRTALSA